MFVLMDMEWYEDKTHWFISQVSALRIDENYSILDRCDSLVSPSKNSNMETIRWENICFAGHKKQDYLLSPDVNAAFTKLYQWLKPDDILVWWHESGEEKFVNRIHLMDLPLSRTQVIGKMARGLLPGKNRKGSLHDLCRRHGIPFSEPEHCSAADVQTLRNLLSAIHFPLPLLKETNWQEKITQVQGAVIPDPKATKALKKAAIRFFYIQDRKNGLIHRSSCAEYNNQKRITKITLQQAVDRRLAPCPCCREKYENYVLNGSKKPRTSSIVYSIKAHENIAHYASCPVVKRIDLANLRKLKSAEHARGAGFHFCKICSSIDRYYKPIKPFVESYCNSHNLRYYLKNGAVHVVSLYDRWQIVIDENTGIPVLYHRNNTKSKDPESAIAGYHRQHKTAHNIPEILRDIADHDRYKKGMPDFKPLKKSERKETRKSRHDNKWSRKAFAEKKRKQQDAGPYFNKADYDDALLDYYRMN